MQIRQNQSDKFSCDVDFSYMKDIYKNAVTNLLIFLVSCLENKENNEYCNYWERKIDEMENFPFIKHN